MLDTIDPRAHGTLDLTLYVLGRPYTYCGKTNIERVTITFCFWCLSGYRTGPAEPGQQELAPSVHRARSVGA